MSWVYVKTEAKLWTVGFWGPPDDNGKPQWFTDDDFDTKEAAADRVHYLNGGNVVPGHPK